MCCLQVNGHLIHNDGTQFLPDILEQQNQVQSLLPEHHTHQRRWSQNQHRSVGVLPQPEPEEETKPFILDLKNFPDLAKADINSQNPNIQVSLCPMVSGKLLVPYCKSSYLIALFLSFLVSAIRMRLVVMSSVMMTFHVACRPDLTF